MTLPTNTPTILTIDLGKFKHLATLCRGLINR